MKKLLPLILASLNINSFAAQVDLNGNLVSIPTITSNHIPYEEPTLGPSPYSTTTRPIIPRIGETIRTPGGWLETAVVAVPNLLI